MSDESPDISPSSSPKEFRENTTQPVRQDPRRDDAANRSRSASASYRVFRRDIIYRSINEFQLSGRRVNAYSDLLSRLSFDLIPLVAEGETWYRCRGKTVNDRPCRRMIPEVYLRTSIGKVLVTAERSDLRGDDLIEELAEGLSYAICSEHHQTIHKIARAVECYRIVEEYRREQRFPEGVTTPIREDSPVPSKASWTIEDQIREAVSRAPSLDRHPGPKPARKGSAPETTSDGQDPMSSYEQAERMKVQRRYQDYLIRASSIRATSRGRRRDSYNSSTASPMERPAERKWRTLERPGS